jgi:hypothetical protein
MWRYGKCQHSRKRTRAVWLGASVSGTETDDSQPRSSLGGQGWRGAASGMVGFSSSQSGIL